MDWIFKKLNLFLSYLLIASITFVIFAFPTYAQGEHKIDFFSASDIAENIENLELNMTSIIYVKNAEGKWEEYQRLHGDENRIWVSIDKIPQTLQDAFIAIEDERFKTHAGVDWKRTVGAVSNFLFKYDNVEYGGSTITQQLIKNITMDKGKNATRKFREIVRAMLIEKHLTKTQILEAYLNTISFSSGICGVQVAANYYFNKDVSELSLVECAALAAITKHPTKYDLLKENGAKENKIRRNTVLDKMLELEFITEKEHKKAYDKDIVIDNSQKSVYEAEINSYFMDALIEDVISDLAEKYNCTENIASTMLYNGGFKIYATVDSRIQSIMENVYLDTDTYFNDYGENLEGYRVHSQSAMTIMDYEGHIVGIVGGAGEKTVNRGLNRATSAPRQPGSTMKPIGVYALAIENDLVNYSSRVIDKPIDNYYPDGKKGPKEWYGYYMGSITLDYALRHSANTIPVSLLKELGIEKSYDFLKNKLGCTYLTEEDKNLSSLALGGCVYGLTTTQSAAAFGIFGSDGIYHEPTTYYKIERANGETVIDYDEGGNRVISSATSTIMNHLLQGVVYGSGGTGRKIASYNYSMKAYAKTGTSSEANDCWMVAGTPYYVGSVWYGFDKVQRVHNTSGAAIIWRDVMKEIHAELEVKQFVDSEDVYKRGSGYYKLKGENATTSNWGNAATSQASSVESVVSVESAVSSTESVTSETVTEQAVTTSPADTTISNTPETVTPSQATSSVSSTVSQPQSNVPAISGNETSSVVQSSSTQGSSVTHNSSAQSSTVSGNISSTVSSPVLEDDTSSHPSPTTSTPPVESSSPSVPSEASSESDEASQPIASDGQTP